MSLSNKRTLQEAGIDDEDAAGSRLNDQINMGLKLLTVLSREAARKRPCNRGPGPQHTAARPLEFRDLPLEIRLMIWEATWPEPSVIEIALLIEEEEGPATGQLTDDARLQPFCSISKWLESDHDWRPRTSSAGGPRNSPAWQPPTERTDIVAFYVNSESRKHTQQNFCWMQHHGHRDWSFYYSPTRDVLWLSDDLWDIDDEDIAELPTAYGRQLSKFKKAIVGMTHSTDIKKLEALKLFGGVHTIQILLDAQHAPTDIPQIQQRIYHRYWDDVRSCARFQLVDRMYNICGKVVPRMRHEE
ncbi:Fc.00g030280.m01.CDS01 [Cosmosporella sp. VM-42]